MVVVCRCEWVLAPTLSRELRGKTDGMAATVPEVVHPSPARRVRVFEAIPGLLDDLAPGHARAAWHRGVAESEILPEGPWLPPAGGELGRGALGLLVLDGVLTRNVALDDRRAPELLGAGDLLRPWEADGMAGFVELDVSWRVIDRAAVALLDEHFADRVCPVPGVCAALLARTFQRSRSMASHAVLLQIRGAERRVLALLWQLADRWGRVTPRGVHVPLRLTHALLAHLVSMRRPTVSAALAALTRSGEVAREGDRTWLLTGGPPDVDRVRGGQSSSTAGIRARI
jgi:hypothetical protein